MSPRSRRSLRRPPRATRAKPTFSYAEPEDTDAEDGDTQSDADTSPKFSNRKIPSRTRKSPLPSKKHHRGTDLDSDEDHISANWSRKRRQSKRSIAKANSHKKLSSPSSSTSAQNSGFIPSWQSLPYHILVQIFEYATYPLYDDHTFQPLPSGSWLLKVARLCRSFAEPAFTVLYTTPPLVPMDKAHKLVDLLKADPGSMAYKYRQKVESLRIDVGQVAAYSLPGSGHLDLHGLVRNLPRLVDLEFYHQKDLSPYRDLDDNIKWSYPDDLFDALEYVNPDADPLRGDKTSACKLRSWRWSSRLARKAFPIESIRNVHLKPAFQNLRKIAFVNYQVPFVKATEEDPEHERVLAKSLSVLKHLDHLIFESSTLVNATLLPLLPPNLRNLELINCWNIKADEFADFLLTHGSQLRCITLNHNQSLSLSFLPVLGTACPKLQVFRMNLTYFQLHSTYRDSDPLYKDLLLPGQVPVWPSKLQTIELIQLRQWQTEAAEMFFQSLLDSAGDLVDLRRLTIQAILNIGWRDRATFRDKWLGSLDRVFKRVSSLPEKFTRSGQVNDSPPVLSLVKRQPVSQDITARRSVRSRSGPSRSSTPQAMSSTVQEEPSKVERSKATKKGKEATSSDRRSARNNTRRITYAESPENSESEEFNLDVPSAQEIGPNNRARRELATLRQTAGRDLLPSSPPGTPSGDEDSNDEALMKRGRGKGKAPVVIQGMCEVVDVRIDNLRPRETHVTEADFLDEEVPGDGDWNEDDDDDF